MRRSRSVLVILGLGTLASLAHAGDGWKVVDSKRVGIRMRVPDPSTCETREQGKLVGMYCDYTELHVVAIAYAGEVDLADLRKAAQEYSDVSAEHWKRQATFRDENGFGIAEAWLAAGKTESALALVGQSARRSASVVVFVYGKNSVWKKHSKEIAHFIETIHAL